MIVPQSTSLLVEGEGRTQKGKQQGQVRLTLLR